MMPLKIGFVLLSNSTNPIPSTRITVLNMFPFLKEANFDPHIVFEPDQGNETPDLSGLAPRLVAEGFKIIYFQKVHGQSVVDLVKHLRVSGVKTVYGVCDLVNEEMTAATDATIVVTDYLKDQYPPTLKSRIYVVHDGIEHPENYKTFFNATYGSRSHPLHAVLVTSGNLNQLPLLEPIPKWLKVSIVGPYLPKTQWMQRMRSIRWQFLKQPDLKSKIAYLRFVANPRIACIPWDPAGVYNIMQTADIGIIPIDIREETDHPTPQWKLKSENRLTLKMSVGLPVIASPIPAYQPIIVQGKNGFLASSKEEWSDYLNLLRNPELRHKIGELARLSVLEKYSKKEQARLLMTCLQKLLSDVTQTT